MKILLYSVASFVAGGVVTVLIAMSFITSTLQSSVLAQNDIYALVLESLAAEKEDELRARSCMALRHGLDNYEEIANSMWALDAPYYSEERVAEINSRANLLIKSGSICK
ncbi:hypothetical protein [Flocculibacter collagenilyticus]|uniref:hypothetical protein n=1 Tax=Flocculibacter collagenilyticus TaxID=2744479 RepID=UPI0018F6CD3B|nr:hypothetical protein [Flocculibacter collagenilyticus]